jgi:acetylornithine deacetylase/succinyl-diaminopimelate desuccinylase-like protein
VRDRPSDRSLIQYLQAHRAEHVGRIREFLEQPSISATGLGIRQAVELLARFHRELGCQEVEVLETDGLPGMWAYLDSGARNTLVTYCMYDTKPVDPDRWRTPPFSGVIEDVPGTGRIVTAPGAKARKGPYVQWLNAIRALLAIHGELPVNIAFLAEGEENVGSPHYSGLIDRYRDRLERAIGCLAPGASQGADGVGAIHLGYKGLISLTLTSSGRLWGRGPQYAPAHGMAQGVVDSPTWRLVAALNELYDAEHNLVKVERFYDALVPLNTAELAELQALARQLGNRSWRQFLPGVSDAATWPHDLSGEEALIRYLYRPSFNINALVTGGNGLGSPAFTIPHEASATLDVRLPRGYNTSQVVDLMRQHLDRQGFDDIQLTVLASHEPAQTSRWSPFVQTFDTLFREHAPGLTYWPFAAGGGPWTRFTHDLGIPVLFDAGLGHGGRPGGPDEFLVLDAEGPPANTVECEAFYAGLIERLGDL